MGDKFSLTKMDVERYLKSSYALENTPVVLVRVEAINEVGYSTLSPGVYLNLKDFGIDKAAADKAEADAKAVSEKAAANKIVADKVATIKKATIICVKGKITKKLTAVKPVCPTGFKKK